MTTEEMTTAATTSDSDDEITTSEVTTVSTRVTFRRLYPTLPPLYDDNDEYNGKPVWRPVSPVSPVTPFPVQIKEENHDTHWDYREENNDEIETVTVQDDQDYDATKDYLFDRLLDKLFNITEPYDDEDFTGYHLFFVSQCHIVYVFLC